MAGTPDSAHRSHPLFHAVKHGLAKQKPGFTAAAESILPDPDNTGPVDEPNPDGLILLYHASSAAEADLLSQILVEAGYHPEYVPSPLTMVAITGNASIYIAPGEYTEALDFLREYFNAPQEPEKPEA